MSEYFAPEPPPAAAAREIVEHNQLDSLTSPETEAFAPLQVNPYAEKLYRQALNEARIQTMLAVLREHDPQTADHTMRTGLYSAHLAVQAGRPEAEILTLAEAGLLHDLGKIAVDPAILHGQNPELSPSERHIVNRHPKIGYNETRLLFADPLVPELVLTHHCHTHKPYTDNHPGSIEIEENPLVQELGEMLAAADFYDALFSDRLHNTGLSRAEKEQKMRSNYTGNQKYLDWMLELHDQQRPEQ
jgi:HD-GYP domain-containing protein (c-di-GMP phosphodiesterase class II)